MVITLRGKETKISEFLLTLFACIYEKKLLGINSKSYSYFKEALSLQYRNRLDVNILMLYINIRFNMALYIVGRARSVTLNQKIHIDKSLNRDLNSLWTST